MGGKRDTKAAKAKRAERRGKGALKTEQKTAIAEGKQERKKAFAKDEEDLDALQHSQSAAWALCQLGSYASSGRAWRSWQLVTLSRSSTHWDAQPQPLPRLLELTFTAAGSTAFDHSGAAQGVCERAGEADGGQGGRDAAALAALERHAHRPPDQGRAHLLRRRALRRQDQPLLR